MLAIEPVEQLHSDGQQREGEGDEGEAWPRTFESYLTSEHRKLCTHHPSKPIREAEIGTESALFARSARSATQLGLVAYGSAEDLT